MVLTDSDIGMTFGSIVKEDLAIPGEVVSIDGVKGAFEAMVAGKLNCTVECNPLLGPAAEHLGIDLIWFGVILGVNMQTSFMHPPFGFALFYLRSVAPRESFLDRVTGKLTPGVTTGQIYWGAVPFVLIQLIAVVSVIMFPAMVMHYKGLGSQVDPSKVRIEIQTPDIPPPPDFGPPPSK